MILGFRTQINGKPTNFVSKIWEGFLQLGIPFNANEFLELSEKALPEGYIIKTYPPKIHTIREDKTNRWKPGVMIDYFINVRTKNMFRFAPKVPVISTQKLEIIFYSDREVLINDLPLKRKIIIDDKRHLKDYEVIELAKNDGFDSVDDFFNYFNDDFTGKIVHWTDKKY